MIPTLMLTPVPKELSASAISQMFGPFGQVLSCEIPLDEQGHPRGYAFVRMVKYLDAESAADALHKTLVNGELLSVTHVSGDGYVRWSELRPDDHSFEPERVYSIALGLVSNRNGQEPNMFNARRITAALKDAFGEWAAYWSYSATDSLDSPWCCPAHSWTSTEETSERIRDNLIAWRQWFEKLQLRFQSFVPERHGDNVGVFRAAAVQLVNDTVEFTHAADNWYGLCEGTLQWYLEYIGIPEGVQDEVVTNVTNDFEDWIEPKDEVVSAVAIEFAHRASKVYGQDLKPQK